MARTTQDSSQKQDSSQTQVRSLAVDERGAVLPMGLLFAIFCFGIGYTVYNMAQAVDYREQMQDRADAAAYGAAAVWAQAMNNVSHLSAQSFAQLDALTLAATLQAIPYICNPPSGFSGCDSSHSPGDVEDLADGIPNSWHTSGRFTTGQYQSEVFGRYPLCPPVGSGDCSAQTSQAISRAKTLPGEYGSASMTQVLNGVWSAANASAAGANLATTNSSVPGLGITTRVDLNTFQSPDPNGSFSPPSSALGSAEAFKLIRCMEWGDVDSTYLDNHHINHVRDIVVRLVSHHGAVVEAQNQANIGAAQTAQQNAQNAINNAASPPIPQGAPITAPFSGTVRLSGTCPSCTATFRSTDGTRVATVSNLDFSFGSPYSAHSSQNISLGQQIGTAAGPQATRTGFAGPAGAVAPKAAWQLESRPSQVQTLVRNAMKQVWDNMRSQGVCFPSISRNTNRYRFLGVATSGVDVNNIFQDNAVVAAVGAPKANEARTGYQMARAGNFAFAQAGIGVTGSANAPERVAQNPSGPWYDIPVHAFGFRNWRPRMVRIEFHRGDEDRYGDIGGTPGPDEKAVWKKVNDAFAH